MKKGEYQLRKAQGLCPTCGKVKVEAGTRCESCREKGRKYTLETRHFRKEMGFCVTCGVNRISGTQSECEDCKSKRVFKATPQGSQNKLEYINKRKIDRLCVSCGGKVQSNHIRCGKCLAKRLSKPDNYKIPYIPKTEYGNNSLCVFCGGTVYKGYKLCERHYNEVVNNFRKGKINNG